MARTTLRDFPRTRFLWLSACIATALAMLLGGAAPAAAKAGQTASPAAQSSMLKKQRGQRHPHKGRRARQGRARRAQSRRARQATRKVSISSNAAIGRRKAKAAPATSSDSGVLDAGFENGLFNWNTAGVGEVLPTVVSDTVRSGGSAARVALTGTEHRSELILGGNGGGSTSGMIEFGEGDEYWYGFSFYIVSMVYGRPGAHNLIMQFKGDDDGSPAFGLQLWDYEGDDEEYEDNPKGLWSHGPSMDGDRFLAPVAEHEWHDVAIHFKASGSGAGFYEVYLDSNLVDSRSGVSMIADGASYAYIKDGLYRNGDEIPGDSEIRLDAARLGHSAADVAVG
ncbi:MAG TPA: heparin lyase I family protein [Solirubrobacterales bacterium]|nr:heparin lyase I family protein [Solirubrobacterales bacterium]